jgi:hypothetical protein
MRASSEIAALNIDFRLLLLDEFEVIGEPLIAKGLGQCAGHASKHRGVVHRIVDRLEAPFLPVLQEGIGTRAAALVVLEFDSRIHQDDNVGIFRGARLLNLLIDDEVHLQQHIDDQGLDPFRQVNEVGVVLPEALGRHRQENLSTDFPGPIQSAAPAERGRSKNGVRGCAFPPQG